MIPHTFSLGLSKAAFAISLLLAAGSQLLAADPLATGFAEPPHDSRPETWFHLIGGNVAKPGLTADLEAVAGAGLSGIQLFHGQFGGPWPGVTPQIACLSPSWDDMITHTADECRRLGLSFTMQNCPGWAMSGGPWIKPENAMRTWFPAARMSWAAAMFHSLCQSPNRAPRTGGTTGMSQ
jgi:hypothetical protein